jgi:hypothetical protein
MTPGGCAGVAVTAGTRNTSHDLFPLRLPRRVRNAAAVILRRLTNAFLDIFYWTVEVEPEVEKQRSALVGRTS